MTFSTPHQAAAMHPTAQQPVSTTQYVAPPWQGKFALFQSSRGKAPYSGRISFNGGDVPQLIAYLQQTQPNERGDVELWLSGFVNTAKTTGQQYIGGYVSPQTQGPAVRYGQQQSAPALVQQAQAGQQQAMANAQHHVYGQPAPGQQSQPAPLPAQTVEEANRWVAQGTPPPF